MRGEPPPDLHAGLAAWPTTTGIRVATAARVTALIRITCRARIGATPHGRRSASDRGRARSARTPKAWWSPCSPTVRIPNLGLHGMAKGFKALEQATEVHALEHAEWLGLLLEHEVTLRRQKRFEARPGPRGCATTPVSKTSIITPRAASIAPCSSSGLSSRPVLRACAQPKRHAR